MRPPKWASAYTRARELCEQVGETPQLFPVLYGLWVFYLARAELQTARELGEQTPRLAQRVQDPAPSCWKPIRRWETTLFCLGELAPGPRALGAGHCPVRPPAAPLPGLPLRVSTRGVFASILRPVSCGSWAIRTKP